MAADRGAVLGGGVAMIDSFRTAVAVFGSEEAVLDAVIANDVRLSAEFRESVPLQAVLLRRQEHLLERIAAALEKRELREANPLLQIHADGTVTRVDRPQVRSLLNAVRCPDCTGAITPGGDGHSPNCPQNLNRKPRG